MSKGTKSIENLQMKWMHENFLRKLMWSSYSRFNRNAWIKSVFLRLSSESCWHFSNNCFTLVQLFHFGEKNVRMIQSPRTILGKSLMSNSRCIFFSHSPHIVLIVILVHIHIFCSFWITIETLLCEWSRARPNTMNRTENHYHSILFSEFSHWSAFFVKKTYPTMFCVSIFGVAVIFCLLYYSIGVVYFFSSLLSRNHSKWLCCTWPCSQWAWKLMNNSECEVCDLKPYQCFALNSCCRLFQWDRKRTKILFNICRLCSVVVVVVSFVNTSNSLAFNSEYPIVSIDPFETIV